MNCKECGTYAYRRQRCQPCQRKRICEKKRARRQLMTPEQKLAWSKYCWANRYGMTPEKLQERISAANGRCELCGDPTPEPHVDHDHTTGKVRGVLCPGCNLGLGHFRESVEKLELAIAYLKREKGGSAHVGQPYAPAGQCLDTEDKNGPGLQTQEVSTRCG